MKLEVGKSYRNKKGEILECISDESYDICIMAKDNRHHYYYSTDGLIIDPFPAQDIDYTQFDIVEEL